MNEKRSSSFQEARDDALRALIVQSGLTPDQVSALRLNQVHLATSTLVIAPDEFSPTYTASQPPVSLTLDETVRRTLIAWLVVRPDGPNDHLFPGTGLDGLDVVSINQAISVGEAVGPPQADELVESTPPSPADFAKADEELAEPAPPKAPAAAAEEPPAEPPTERPVEAPAVPLDEIETLRRRLAEAYDVWAPALPLPSARPEVESISEIEVPSEPLPEPEPSVEVHEPEVPVEPVLPLPEEVRFKPPETKRPRPEETSIEELAPTPEKISVEEMVPTSEEELAVGEPAGPTPGGAFDRLAALWRSEGKKVTFKLSPRALTIGGLALVVVVCCLGLALAGGTVLGSGGLAGLLAAVTPSATQAPSQTPPPVTFTPAPSVTPTDHCP
jgi:hypothetical protein